MADQIYQTIILVGHGSSFDPQAQIPVMELADKLSKSKKYGNIKAGFLKGRPALVDVIAAAPEGKILILPITLCKGFVVNKVLPDIAEQSGRDITISNPIGHHPDINSLFAQILEKSYKTLGSTSQNTDILMVGHGSQKGGASAMRTRNAAQYLNEHGLAENIHSLFLEQPPYASNWQDDVTCKNVIVMPFLIANGRHVSLDIPKFLGLNEKTDDAIYNHRDKRLFIAQPLSLTFDLSKIIEACLADHL